MPPLTSAQKSVLNQFISITGVPEKSATKLLKSSQWKLEHACDSFFASNGTAPRDNQKEALEKLFEKYRSSKTDEIDLINVDGTMAYLNALGVNLESAEMLIPLEIIKAPAFGEIEKEPFVNGWRAVGADTVAKQKAYVSGQVKLLKSDMTLLKRVYRHTFVCSKERAQKALPLENAIVYWGMLFSAPGKPWITASTNWIELWIEFLNAKWTKSVNKDMWNQTFEFFLKTMEDETLGFWKEDSAWPGVIDEFVAYAKKKREPLPESMETD